MEFSVFVNGSVAASSGRAGSPCRRLATLGQRHCRRNGREPARLGAASGRRPRCGGRCRAQAAFHHEAGQAGHQIRSGDDVEFLVAEPAECPARRAPLVDAQRAVGVALVLGSTDSAGKTAAG